MACPVRKVMVDRGYGQAENWVKAKVVRSHWECKDPFTGKPREQLLIELPGGERVWVDFWKNVL